MTDSDRVVIDFPGSRDREPTQILRVEGFLAEFEKRLASDPDGDEGDGAIA